MLEKIFGSRLRAKLLVRLFRGTDTRYYIRQLAVLIGEDSTNISRELARLEEIGILVSTTEGKQKYYQANQQSPVFKEIRNLMTRLSVRESSIMPALPGLLSRRLKINRPALTGFCRQNHVQKLSLFGSVLRADFKPESDIDVLVEFQPGKPPGFLKLAGMEEELSTLIGGRKVDLRTPQDLSKHFRDQVLQEAQVLCQ
jgi:predicted nucleotidyltransferase